MATIGPTGTPHVMGMWYGVIDGQIWFETTIKSQKVQNLRRDDRLTCMTATAKRTTPFSFPEQMGVPVC